MVSTHESIDRTFGDSCLIVYHMQSYEKYLILLPSDSPAFTCCVHRVSLPVTEGEPSLVLIKPNKKSLPLVPLQLLSHFSFPLHGKIVLTHCCLTRFCSLFLSVRCSNLDPFKVEFSKSKTWLLCKYKINCVKYFIQLIN